MFPSRIQGIVRLHFILQLGGGLALLWLCYLLVNWFRFDGTLGPRPYWDASMVLVAATFLELLTRPASARNLAGQPKQQLCSISHRQSLFALSSICGMMVMLKDDGLSRVFLILFFSLYFVWIMWSNRCGFRYLNHFLYRSPSKGLVRTLLIGSPEAIEKYSGQAQAPAIPGSDILGCVAVGPENGGAVAIPASTLQWFGSIQDLHRICIETKARALVLLGLTDRRDLVAPLSRVSSELGLRTMWLDDVSEQFGPRSQAFHTQNYSVVTRLREPLEDPINRVLKRLMDLAFSGAGILLLLAPALLCVFVLQRFRSPGPLFFRQKRSGRNGESFEILKFRTMHVAEPDAPFDQARKCDPRIFPGGDLLRKLSVDELPQLINVFKGEMSLVGPRPHPLPLDDSLARESASYRLRNLAKPGITGLAQCSGWRGETRQPIQVRNRIRLDLFYIQNWSVGLDLSILFRTIWQVIRPPKSAC